MGNNDKKQRQRQAERVSRQTRQREQAAASALESQLGARRATVSEGLFGEGGDFAANRAGARDLRETGGYDQNEVGRIRGSLGDIGSSYKQLGETGGFDPSKIRERLGNIGSGYEEFSETGGFDPSRIRGLLGESEEGYRDFAKTGGFSDEQRQSFLRRGTAPTAAIYSSLRDRLNRGRALQGGYSPGFGGSSARLARHAAQAGSEASLNANVDLESQIRQGRALGLGGLGDTARTQQGLEESLREGRHAGLTGQERLAGQEQGLEESLRQGRVTGLQGQQGVTAQEQNLEGNIAAGRRAGQDALDRVTRLGVSALTQTDIASLQNRMQSGQLGQADSQLLARLASQDRGLFDNIIAGVGAAAGAATAFLPTGGG